MLFFLKRVVKAGALYFALVFAAGFVFGPIRILWIVPRFGTRLAELMELPLMLGVIIIAARWVIKRFAVPPGLSSRLNMGCIALSMMLVAEFSLVLQLRGLSIKEYFTTMDPISGTAFFVMQGVFALMPLIVGRR
jgi:hypothetical protein